MQNTRSSTRKQSWWVWDNCHLGDAVVPHAIALHRNQVRSLTLALKGSLGTSQCPSPFVLVAVLGSLCEVTAEVTHSLSQNPQLMLVATSPSACHICSKTQSCGICMSHLPLWRYDLGNAKHEQRPAEF